MTEDSKGRRGLLDFKDIMTIRSDRILLRKVDAILPGAKYLTEYGYRQLSSDRHHKGLVEASDRNHTFNVSRCFEDYYAEKHPDAFADLHLFRESYTPIEDCYYPSSQNEDQILSAAPTISGQQVIEGCMVLERQEIPNTGLSSVASTHDLYGQVTASLNATGDSNEGTANSTADLTTRSITQPILIDHAKRTTQNPWEKDPKSLTSGTTSEIQVGPTPEPSIDEMEDYFQSESDEDDDSSLYIPSPKSVYSPMRDAAGRFELETSNQSPECSTAKPHLVVKLKVGVLGLATINAESEEAESRAFHQDDLNRSADADRLPSSIDSGLGDDFFDFEEDRQKPPSPSKDLITSEGTSSQTQNFTSHMPASPSPPRDTYDGQCKEGRDTILAVFHELEKALSSAKKAEAEARQKGSMLQDQLSVAQGATAKIARENAALKQESESWKCALNEEKKNTARQGELVIVLEEQNIILRDTGRKQDDEIVRIRKQLAVQKEEWNQRVQGLEADLEAEKLKNSVLADSQKHLRENIEGLNNARLDRDKQIVVLNAEIDNHVQILSNCQKERDAYEAEVTSLCHQLAEERRSQTEFNRLAKEETALLTRQKAYLERQSELIDKRLTLSEQSNYQLQTDLGGVLVEYLIATGQQYFDVLIISSLLRRKTISQPALTRMSAYPPVKQLLDEYERSIGRPKTSSLQATSPGSQVYMRGRSVVQSTSKRPASPIDAPSYARMVPLSKRAKTIEPNTSLTSANT